MSAAPVPQPLAPVPQSTAPSAPALSPRARARLQFWATFLFLILLVGAASAAIYRYRQAQPAAVLPSAPARLGDFLVIVRCRGELKAERSVQVYTPMVPSLRIAWMTPPGMNVKAGDPIVRFDSSSAQQTLMQKDAALRQAQATLDQALAQSKITGEQDRTDLADAGFTVERARLEASKQEIVSRLQGEESKIDYGVAQQKQKVQEATVDLHAASDRSRIASLTRQRDQAKSDVDITKERIAQMELKSPLSGFLIFQSNYSQGWMNAKPFKVGDNVYGGMVLAEMPDLTTMLMDAKVEEIDRGRISADQEVRVRIDSLPELTLTAKIRQISLLAEASNEFPPVRSFRAYAAIPKPDERLRPGMNGGMDIIINRIPRAISIPAKALFTHAGKPVVYVAENGRYRAVIVEVLARNPDEIAVKGIPDGAMVTLVDPNTTHDRKGASLRPRPTRFHEDSSQVIASGPPIVMTTLPLEPRSFWSGRRRVSGNRSVTAASPMGSDLQQSDLHVFNGASPRPQFAPPHRLASRQWAPDPRADNLVGALRAGYHLAFLSDKTVY